MALFSHIFVSAWKSCSPNSYSGVGDFPEVAQDSRFNNTCTDGFCSQLADRDERGRNSPTSPVRPSFAYGVSLFYSPFLLTCFLLPEFCFSKICFLTLFSAKNGCNSALGFLTCLQHSHRQTQHSWLSRT